MDDRDKRIAEMAFYLWEQEGCPEGQAERHWYLAKDLIAKEDRQRKDVEGEPPGEKAEEVSQPRRTRKGPRPAKSLL
jgi:hypothetical protein